MKTEYNFKNRLFFSYGPQLFGLVLIPIGFFTLVSPLFMADNNSTTKAIVVGSIAIILGGMIITSYPGTFFDFKNKRFKTYYALVGYKFGQWKTFPPLKLIKVFPYTFRGRMMPNGVNPTPTIQVTKHIVALYGDQPKPVVSMEYNKRNDALEGAKIISDGMNATLDIQLS